MRRKQVTQVENHACMMDFTLVGKGLPHPSGLAVILCTESHQRSDPTPSVHSGRGQSCWPFQKSGNVGSPDDDYMDKVALNPTGGIEQNVGCIPGSRLEQQL